MKRAALAMMLVSLAAAAQDVTIPDENRANRSESPPPRPDAGDLADRMRILLQAIVADLPEQARELFFPRDPFRVLKGIAQPDRYWQVLWQHYQTDIHAMHAELPAEARFDRITLNRRGGWVRVREEANALPYWCSRHSNVYYRAGEREAHFEVRTLITWGTSWYLTHLR